MADSDPQKNTTRRHAARALGAFPYAANPGRGVFAAREIAAHVSSRDFAIQTFAQNLLRDEKAELRREI